jgi:hypothetical protein
MGPRALGSSLIEAEYVIDSISVDFCTDFVSSVVVGVFTFDCPTTETGFRLAKAVVICASVTSFESNSRINTFVSVPSAAPVKTGLTRKGPNVVPKTVVIRFSVTGGGAFVRITPGGGDG